MKKSKRDGRWKDTYSTDLIPIPEFLNYGNRDHQRRFNTCIPSILFHKNVQPLQAFLSTLDTKKGDYLGFWDFAIRAGRVWTTRMSLKRLRWRFDLYLFLSKTGRIESTTWSIGLTYTRWVQVFYGKSFNRADHHSIVADPGRVDPCHLADQTQKIQA